MEAKPEWREVDPWFAEAMAKILEPATEARARLEKSRAELEELRTSTGPYSGALAFMQERVVEEYERAVARWAEAEADAEGMFDDARARRAQAVD